MRWLRRREPGTCRTASVTDGRSRRACAGSSRSRPAQSARGGANSSIEERARRGPSATECGTLRRDHPGRAGLELLRLAADRERQRARGSGSRLLVRVLVLGHVGVRARARSPTSVASVPTTARPTSPSQIRSRSSSSSMAERSSCADRVPDGLQLEERRDLVQRLASGLPWTTRLTFSAAATSRSVRRPSAPVRSIAFTSMWLASHGASSARWPVSRLTTPPGTSLVAIASASSIAASGCVSDASATTALPPVSAGASRETRPSSGGSSGATTATTPVGSGIVKLKYGPGDRVRRAEHLRELVGEAGVPDPAVDRALDLVRAAAELGELGQRAPPSSRRSGRAPGRGCTPSPTAHFGCAPRAACTASRASLRDARATFWPCAS